MDPERFLETADLLREVDPMTEPDARTVVGRAYYSLLVTVRDQVQAASGVAPRPSQSHAFVAEWLKRCERERRMGTLSANCRRLRLARERADYEMSASPENWNAQSVAQRVDEARAALAMFREGLAALGPDIVRQHAQAAIAEIERRRAL